MKRLLRHYVVDTFCLWAISQIATGLVFEKGTQTLLLAGVGVMTVSLLAKPVINLLLLPINLITFGLFRWVSSAIILYLVTLVVKDFKIIHFKFLGFESAITDIPPLYFEGFAAFIAFSFLISLISSFIYWLVK